MVLLSLAALLAACGGAKPLCLFRDTINKPESRSQRRALMQGGLSQFCRQMVTRNAPLKLSDDTPIIGRFYPQDCRQRELENGDLSVQFSGFGYGWTNLSKKVTFTMSGAVDYNQDFLIAEEQCDLYGYFRTRRIHGSDFRIVKIEQQFASFMNALSPVGENFGRQLVTGKLGEGFTVIHDHTGNDDFGLGVIPVGRRPFHPFQARGKDRIVYENLRTEVHQNQRDFIGPIEVTEAGRQLYLTLQVDGAAAIDLFVMTKEQGDSALRLYFDYPQSGPLLTPPMLTDVVRGGAPYTRSVPAPKGLYWVVLDNTPTAGPTMPPQNPYDDRAALVSYAIEIGD